MGRGVNPDWGWQVVGRLNVSPCTVFLPHLELWIGVLCLLFAKVLSVSHFFAKTCC